MVGSQVGGREDAPLAAESEQSAPSIRYAVLLSVLTFAVYMFGHTPRILQVPVSLFDEGIQLSLPFFVSEGLIPFRDFYIPYGPGNGLIGALSSVFVGDSILANRLLFVTLQGVLAGLATYLICRRRGLVAGLFMAVITTSFSSAATYTMTFVCLVAGVLTLIGWRYERNPFGTASPDRLPRLVVAGALFGFAAWFRFEFAFVLVVWSALVWLRPLAVGEQRWSPWFWLPWAVGAAPYVPVLVVGGADEMFYALRYAAIDYETYRGVAADLTEPLELFGQGASDSPIDWEALVIGMSFWAAWIGLALVAVGPLLDRWRPGLRPYSKDSTRIIVLLVIVMTFGMYSLGTRGDHGHAAQLIIPAWLVLLWTPLRWRTAGRFVAAAVALLVLVAGQPFTLDRWEAAAASFDEHGSAPFTRGARVPYSGEDAEQLASLLGFWTELGSPEQVFVANRTNDITHINAVVVYWLLEAEPATWMTTFDPGFADQAEYHEIMVEDLCESGAPVVLMHTQRSSEHPPDRRFSPYLDRFLALNYELYDANERFDVRTQSTETCVKPEAVSSYAELEALRTDLLSAGEIIPAAVVGEWQLDLRGDSDVVGDRILLAEQAGLWHDSTELSGVHRDLLLNWRRARDPEPPDTQLALSLDPSDPSLTGVTLYIEGLLVARDGGKGIETAHSPNALFLEAVLREPALGGLELLQRSIQRGEPGYSVVAEAIRLANPTNPGALEQHGIALFDDKKYSEALTAFQQAAAHATFDDRARMVNHVGSALRALGDLSCSVAAFDAAAAAGLESAEQRRDDAIAEGGSGADCTDLVALDAIAVLK